MQYATKLKAYPSSNAYDCGFHPLYENGYDEQPNTIHPFGLRVKSHFDMYSDDIAIINPENPPLLKPYTTTIGTIKRVPTAMILLHDTHVAFPETSISRFPVKSSAVKSAQVKSVPSKNGLKMKVKSVIYFKLN